MASAERAVSDWGRDLPPLLPHVDRHTVGRGKLANRRQGLGVFWLGKLRPQEGTELTQSHTAHLVRAQDQSLPKPPDASFPCNLVAGLQQTGTK